MKPNQALMEAADLIERGGWCQGFFNNPFGGGEHCVLGAIYQVTYASSQETQDSAIVCLLKYLGAPYSGTSKIAAWNDRFDQTASNVIKTMRQAAEAVHDS